MSVSARRALELRHGGVMADVAVAMRARVEMIAATGELIRVVNLAERRNGLKLTCRVCGSSARLVNGRKRCARSAGHGDRRLEARCEMALKEAVLLRARRSLASGRLEFWAAVRDAARLRRSTAGRGRAP